MSDIGQFSAFEDGRGLARAIVNTVREPLLVLDKDLRVVAASRSFYETFQADRQETQGRLLYTLGDGQWDIPALRIHTRRRVSGADRGHVKVLDGGAADGCGAVLSPDGNRRVVATHSGLARPLLAVGQELAGMLLAEAADQVL